jgi:phosphatidylethanolamine-binding protein (PEBP) family uncharacterized protein
MPRVVIGKKESSMKYILFISLLLSIIVFFSCEKVSHDVVDFELDFEWGTALGENQKNPEIRLTGVPHTTRSLEVQLVDLDLSFADHGEVEKILYSEDGVIPYGALKNYIGPSPPPRGHMYEFTIKALDEKGVPVGIGKKAKRCCKKVEK